MSLSRESKVQIYLMGKEYVGVTCGYFFKSNFLKYFHLFFNHILLLLLHTNEVRDMFKGIVKCSLFLLVRKYFQNV